MSSKTSRSHRLTVDAVIPGFGPFSQLCEEWRYLHHSLTTSEQVHTWAQQVASLAGCETIGDILDRIDHAHEHDSNAEERLLQDLHLLHRGGDSLAGRILLQVMLPALVGLTNSRRAIGGEVASDRMHNTLTGFWSALSAYDPNRHCPGLYTFMRLNTLRHLRRFAINKGISFETPASIEYLDALAQVGDTTMSARLPTPDKHAATDSDGDQSIYELLFWALEEGIASKDEIALLVQVYLPHDIVKTTSHTMTAAVEVAAQMNTTPEALRKSCQRIIAKIRDAVVDDTVSPLAGLQSIPTQQTPTSQPTPTPAIDSYSELLAA